MKGTIGEGGECAEVGRLFIVALLSIFLKVFSKKRGKRCFQNIECFKMKMKRTKDKVLIILNLAHLKLCHCIEFNNCRS